MGAGEGISNELLLCLHTQFNLGTATTKYKCIFCYFELATGLCISLNFVSHCCIMSRVAFPLVEK
jgi:hypothetical protein